MECIIAREVIYAWNGLHSWPEKKVLVPLLDDSSSSSSTTLEPSDLLVAFFSTSQGAPSSDATRLTDDSIAQQIKSGRPALIYLSEARIGLEHATVGDAAAVSEFKSRFPAEAMVDSFADEKELRSKFAQQLESAMRYHPGFRSEGEADSTAPVASIPETHPPAPEFSESAQALLMGACDDPEAYVARTKDSRGVRIQVNGRQFVEAGNAESAAMWESAFQELLEGGLIRDVGCNGQLFQISSQGFAFLETLGKFPIGYIAELGGM